jgi:hypothetical protein
MLVEEVVFGRVVEVGLTGRHGVEHLERANERTRGHLVDGELTIGHLGDVIDGQHEAASSKMAKPSGTDVTMVSVRLPWAYAGAARVVVAAAAPPSADVRRNERRSIGILPIG